MSHESRAHIEESLAGIDFDDLDERRVDVLADAVFINRGRVLEDFENPGLVFGREEDDDKDEDILAATILGIGDSMVTLGFIEGSLPTTKEIFELADYEKQGGTILTEDSNGKLRPGGTGLRGRSNNRPWKEEFWYGVNSTD